MLAGVATHTHHDEPELINLLSHGVNVLRCTVLRNELERLEVQVLRDQRRQPSGFGVG